MPTIKKRSILVFIFGGMCLLLYSKVNASPDLSPFPKPLAHEGGCLTCHTDPDFEGVFKNGEKVSLGVEFKEFAQSIHGSEGVLCEDCHQDKAAIPHHENSLVECMTCHGETGEFIAPDFSELKVDLIYQDPREMTLALNNVCSQCHQEEFEAAGDSIHNDVLQSGNIYAPVCVDCHGSHAMADPNQPRQKSSQICGECHLAVYSTYQISVHGTALEEESNPDVPTCVDCHSVHNVHGPRDLEFRNNSILVCGECHTDAAMMDKYGLSTNVLDTYLDDFHGRTANLFRIQDESNPSNTAVCYDCHGIHNILRPEDPHSEVYPANLQDTCAKCHQEAGITFPDAWLSHYSPKLETNPTLYIVNILYPILIAGTLGGMTFYIVLDGRRRLIDIKKEKSNPAAEPNEPEAKAG